MIDSVETNIILRDRLYDEFRSFTKDKELVLIVNTVSPKSVDLKFFDGYNCERNYTYHLMLDKEDDWDKEFIKIMREVTRALRYEEPVKKSITDELERVRTVDICGLSKNEYIALELTKAWASTTAGEYYDSEDIVGRYYEMLEEVEKRG